MADNIIPKLLGLFLNIAAHMAFSVSSHTSITQDLGTNVTFKFIFKGNVSLCKDCHFAIYRNITGKGKIAEFKSGKAMDVFDVFPENSSVSWSLANLNLSDSGSYWASLFQEQGPAKESDKVQLIVQEVNRSSTDPPKQNNDSSGSSYLAVAILVVLALLLLTVALPGLIWSLVTPTDKQQLQQQPPPLQSFDSVALETVDASVNVTPVTMVYSVLDFPKRSSAVSEVNSNDTEYAAVSYLPEKRLV